MAVEVPFNLPLRCRLLLHIFLPHLLLLLLSDTSVDAIDVSPPPSPIQRGPIYVYEIKPERQLGNRTRIPNDEQNESDGDEDPMAVLKQIRDDFYAVLPDDIKNKIQACFRGGKIGLVEALPYVFEVLPKKFGDEVERCFRVNEQQPRAQFIKNFPKGTGDLFFNIVKGNGTCGVPKPNFNLTSGMALPTAEWMSNSIKAGKLAMKASKRVATLLWRFTWNKEPLMFCNVRRLQQQMLDKFKAWAADRNVQLTDGSAQRLLIVNLIEETTKYSLRNFLTNRFRCAPTAIRSIFRRNRCDKSRHPEVWQFLKNIPMCRGERSRLCERLTFVSGSLKGEEDDSLSSSRRDVEDSREETGRTSVGDWERIAIDFFMRVKETLKRNPSFLQSLVSMQLEAGGGGVGIPSGSPLPAFPPSMAPTTEQMESVLPIAMNLLANNPNLFGQVATEVVRTKALDDGISGLTENNHALKFQQFVEQMKQHPEQLGQIFRELTAEQAEKARREGGRGGGGGASAFPPGFGATGAGPVPGGMRFPAGGSQQQRDAPFVSPPTSNSLHLD